MSIPKALNERPITLEEDFKTFGVNDTPLQSVFISEENEIWAISKLGDPLDCALVRDPAASPAPLSAGVIGS